MMRSIILALCLLFTSSACVFTFAQKTKSAEEKGAENGREVGCFIGANSRTKG